MPFHTPVDVVGYATKYRNLVMSHMDAHRKTWDESAASIASEPSSPLRVFIRVRPLLPKDLEQDAFMLAAIQPPRTVHFTHPTLTWSGGRFATKTYEADGAFDVKTTNEHVWSTVGMDRVIGDCMQREKEVFIVAYGQTGTGKTFTTTYLESRLSEEIFTDSGIAVSISAFELRGSKAYDLLSDPPFHPVKIIGSAGNAYPGLSETSASSKEKLLQFVETAGQLRATRSTLKNDTSSRSHSIMRFSLTYPDGHTSSIFIIDLAGSERATTAGANSDPARQQEAIATNKSLAALKDCIRARLSRSDRIPWRTDKLTMILQRAFINEETSSELIIIACVSPSVLDSQDTLGTLNYITPFRLSGRASVDAVVTTESLGVTQHEDPRRWSHEQSVLYLTRNFPKIVPFLPRLLPPPSCTLNSILGLSQEELWGKLSTPIPNDKINEDTRMLAQAKVALGGFYNKLTRLADEATALDGEKSSNIVNVALASTRKNLNDILDGKGREVNVTKETRVGWSGEHWDLSKR